MILTDAHTHAIPSDPDRVAMVNLTPGMEPEAGQPGGKLFFSCGIHPADAKHFSLDQLREILRKVPCSALGECGLDALVPIPREQQEKIFQEQIILAEELHLPMIIHCIRKHYDLIRLRKKCSARMPWLIHGFRGKPELGKTLLKAGCLLSLSPVWLLHQTEFPGWLPQNAFLLETDESNLSLQEIYLHAAKLRHEPLEALAELLQRNFRQFICAGVHHPGL